MTLTINSDRGRNERPPEIDLAPFISAMFGFVLKGARRIVKLTEEEIESLKELAFLLPKASEQEKAEIIEAMLETLFPDENIGGVSDQRPPINAEAMARVESCRKHVGSAIRELRITKGMTQEELAKEAGIPQSYVSRLEHGKHTPTHLTIEKVAEALGVHPSKIDIGYPQEE